MATATKSRPKGAKEALPGAFEDPTPVQRGRDFYTDMVEAMTSPGKWYRLPGKGYATGTKVQEYIERMKQGDIKVPNELADWEFAVGRLDSGNKQLYVRYNGEAADEDAA